MTPILKNKTIYVPYCVSERGKVKVQVNRGPWWGLAADTVAEAEALAEINGNGLKFKIIKATYQIPDEA